jgi:hypothetical protein
MLAGPPVRFSPATDRGEGIWHDGCVKLRLGHSRRGTVIVPDLIFVRAGPWRFFQPSFFGPCLIGFNVEPGLHVAEFSADVGSPRSTRPTRLILRVRSDAHVMAYSDGSQLYACQLNGSPHLAPWGSGRCQKMVNGDFALQLFHHTNPAAYSSIRASQELWSSAWNLQGTRRLTNVAYVYLTSLPRIERPEDLNRIAMASDGVEYSNFRQLPIAMSRRYSRSQFTERIRKGARTRLLSTCRARSSLPLTSTSIPQYPSLSRSWCIT